MTMTTTRAEGVIPGDWYSLYGDSWQGEIDPAAFAHPAKFAHGLIRRIYQHLLGNDYIRPGDSVIDPFGGVALGARYALQYGLHWTGVELEENFRELGQRNIELWNGRYAPHFPQWGTARLMQGDSRRLAEVVGMKAAVCVSSPPYAGNRFDGGEESLKKKQGFSLGYSKDGGYGENSPGQLGSMPEGQFAAAISSPPYADAVKTGEGPGARFDFVYHNGANGHKMSSTAAYGSTPGNLGNMEGVGYDAAIASPPFEDGSPHNGGAAQFITNKRLFGDYGDTPGNIGNDQGETFWTAARLIVEQVYTVLRPGGCAVWVCKDFVRNKERVPFSDQWEQLCAAVGFEPAERIRSWVVEDRGTQYDIFGNGHNKVVERKSFFRRLAERKGSPRIDWEDVIIMRKECQ